MSMFPVLIIDQYIRSLFLVLHRFRHCLYFRRDIAFLMLPGVLRSGIVVYERRNLELELFAFLRLFSV